MSRRDWIRKLRIGIDTDRSERSFAEAFQRHEERDSGSEIRLQVKRDNRSLPVATSGSTISRAHRVASRHSSPLRLGLRLVLHCGLNSIR